MDYSHQSHFDIERLESCPVNLGGRNSKRPKSLIEMSVKDHCNFLYRHSADLSNKKLALFVLKLSKSTLPFRQRHRNDVINRVDCDLVRPVTWGPNGSNFAGLVSYLSGGSPFSSMDEEYFSKNLTPQKENILEGKFHDENSLNSGNGSLNSSVSNDINDFNNNEDATLIVKDLINAMLEKIEKQEKHKPSSPKKQNCCATPDKKSLMDKSLTTNSVVESNNTESAINVHILEFNKIETVVKDLINTVVNNIEHNLDISADHTNFTQDKNDNFGNIGPIVSNGMENSNLDKEHTNSDKSAINLSSEKLIEPLSGDLQRSRDHLKSLDIVGHLCVTTPQNDVNINLCDDSPVYHDRNLENAGNNISDVPQEIKASIDLNDVISANDNVTCEPVVMLEQDHVDIENGIVGYDYIPDVANHSLSSEYSSMEDQNITVIENVNTNQTIGSVIDQRASVDNVTDDVIEVVEYILKKIVEQHAINENSFDIISNLVNDLVLHVCCEIDTAAKPDTSPARFERDAAIVVTTPTHNGGNQSPCDNNLQVVNNTAEEIDTVEPCLGDESESSMESLESSAQFQQRPSTLEIGKWKSDLKIFSYLKAISTEDLTPVAHYSSLGDIFSEESELALEEALVESSGSENDFSATLTNNHSDTQEINDTSFESKTLSLPPNFVPDFSQYQHKCSVYSNHNTQSPFTIGGGTIHAFLKATEEGSKRDSALSRESAASSGTVVASDDEMDLLETSNHRNTIVSSHGLLTPETNGLLTPEISGMMGDKVFVQKRRSKSLDRNQLFAVNITPQPAKATSSAALYHRKHTRSDDVMLKAPTITITPDPNGISFYNGDVTNHRQNGVTSSKHSRASSFASLSSKHSSHLPDDYEVSAWSSPSSSLSSSPTNSPLLFHPDGTRIIHRALRDRETKIAERQAADVCKWLRAAGFPQYAHLYEVGAFPVDLESVNVDHDFLGQEHIAALIRRLNVLNKCANLKLDKSLSKETQTDEEDDEDEQCAISELWHLDGSNRWSRLDSKSSSLDGATENSNQRTSSSGAVSNLPQLHEEDENETEVFHDKRQARQPVDIKNGDARAALEFARRMQQTGSSGHLEIDGKAKSVIKSKSFLKRVGLEKFGSFRRKDYVLLRTHSTEDTVENKRSNKNRHLSGKSFRKNKKLTIGQPTLQSGHEKVDRMKCIPIEGSKDFNTTTQSRLRKNSCQSLISSSSSSASGSTSASSTPAFRMRGVDEDITTRSDPGDLGPISPGILERNRNILEYSNRNRVQPQPVNPEQNIFVVPKSHVPGKFPSAIRKANDDEDFYPSSSGPSSRSPSSSDSVHPLQSSDDIRRLTRPGSIYDNIPSSGLGAASAQDILDILDPSTSVVNDSGVYTVGSLESLDNPAPDTAFWSVDEIVEQTESLKNFVSTWEADEEHKTTSTSIETLDRLLPTPQEIPSSYSSENIAHEDEDAENVNLSYYHQRRPSSKCRWVYNRHVELGTDTDSLQLHSLSVGQLMILRRLSLLKLTALMESYASNHNNKGTINWSVPRFIRRIKVPDYKDKGVFGVPLLHNVQRFGQPLPQCIQHALLYLRRTALDQVGLFRKPGVKSRIQRLRNMCESNPDLKTFEDCTPFDVADMVKQFFRDLPDPLMTMKMSETFVGIFLYVPTELRLQTLQAATMLLPDEVRETLKTLLCFLSDVAFCSNENQMNEANLATCFAPSLFYQQLNSARTMTSASSPKVRKHQGNKISGIALGRPDMKEMNENMAANQCLAFMIQEVNNLFKISEDAMTQCRMSVMQQTEDVLAAEIGYSCDPGKEVDYYKDFHQFVDRTVAQTIREEQRISQNKGGWQTVPSAQGSELMFKKMNDGNHLRMWRCQVEVSGSTPAQIMERILQERHLWDDNLAQWKVLQKPDERTQVFQTVIDEMSPHPTRDYCVLRSWRTDVNDKGTSAIIETSTAQQTLLGDVRGVVLTSRYLIEPTDNPNKCLLTHVSRVDTKGRNPEWYNKAFGHIKVQQLLQIKESLKRSKPSLEG